MKLHVVFDEEYNITIGFKGVTKSDGVRTVTPPMIIDKIADSMSTLLKEQLRLEFINEYSIKVVRVKKVIRNEKSGGS